MILRALVRFNSSTNRHVAEVYNLEQFAAFDVPTVEQARNELKAALARECTKVVKKIIHDANIRGSSVSCPEGFLNKSTDSWYCKLNEKICMLQASVDTSDEKHFMDGCHAEEEKKKAIFKAILTGKYSGFHHVPGRYRCIACESKDIPCEKYELHFRFEMSGLDKALKISNNKLLRLLKRHGQNTNYALTLLCAPCCLELAQILLPKNADGLEVIEFHTLPNFYP
jgi:hypothetical protein